MRYRIEKDQIGELKVPLEAYYGIQTLRSKENFEITKRGICRQLIKALAIVKKAAAKANIDSENIDENVGKAIMLACDEILNGRLHGQFVTDLIQGGAGTSMNMNINEVVANRANEILGGKKGIYDLVHPLNHVNCSQSTNDVVQTAGKIAVIKQLKKLQVELKKLINSCTEKANEYKDIVKIGRTHLQEAVPITLGQQFLAYANGLAKEAKRIDLAIDALCEVNIGATAIGTGINTTEKYRKKVVFYLNKFSGEPVKLAKDLIDTTRNLDAFGYTSSCLKLLALNLSRIANDIRLMSSNAFHEIKLPCVQPGATNMPGKFNPVIPEMLNQVCFYVVGLDTTISMALEAGQLELNVFLPIVLMSLFEQLSTLRRGIRTFNTLAVSQIENDVNSSQIDNDTYIITAFAPTIGYEQAGQIIKEANEKNVSVKELLLQKNILSIEQIESLFDLKSTKPGVMINKNEI